MVSDTQRRQTKRVLCYAGIIVASVIAGLVVYSFGVIHRVYVLEGTGDLKYTSEFNIPFAGHILYSERIQKTSFSQNIDSRWTRNRRHAETWTLLKTFSAGHCMFSDQTGSPIPSRLEKILNWHILAVSISFIADVDEDLAGSIIVCLLTRYRDISDKELMLVYEIGFFIHNTEMTKDAFIRSAERERLVATFRALLE